MSTVRSTSEFVRQGQPLSGPVRHSFESRLGMDFSDVRIHEGHQASSIGALAYTQGQNIYFQPGHYN